MSTMKRIPALSKLVEFTCPDNLPAGQRRLEELSSDMQARFARINCNPILPDGVTSRHAHDGSRGRCERRRCCWCRRKHQLASACGSKSHRRLDRLSRCECRAIQRLASMKAYSCCTHVRCTDWQIDPRPHHRNPHGQELHRCRPSAFPTSWLQSE